MRKGARERKRNIHMQSPARNTRKNKTFPRPVIKAKSLLAIISHIT